MWPFRKKKPELAPDRGLFWPANDDCVYCDRHVDPTTFHEIIPVVIESRHVYRRIHNQCKHDYYRS